MQNLHGFEPLHLAVWLGHVQVVKELISNGANTRGVAFHGYAPIDIAALKGNREMIEVIVQSCVEGDGGKFVDELIRLGSGMVYDGHFYTPLKHLILEKDFSEEFFGFLLKLGESVDAKNVVGESPLHIAALHGNEKAIKLLVENGAKMDPICINSRFTPLHFAVYKGHNGAVKLLLEKGADTSARIPFSKLAAIDLAASLGHVDIVETLILHSLSSSSALSESLSSVLVGDNVSTLSKELVEMGQYDPYQPLACKAAKNNKPQLIEFVELLGGFIGKEEEEEEEPNREDIINEQGIPYYSYDTATHNPLYPDEAFIEGVNETLQKNKYPIMVAVKAGSAEAVEVLLRKGVNPRFECILETFKCKEEMPINEFAIYYGHLGVLKVLVPTKQELLNQKDELVYRASFEGKTDVVQWMIDQGVELTMDDKSWLAPMHAAACNGQAEMVEFLIRKGLPVDEKHERGLTPLLLAVKRNIAPTNGDHVKTAMILIENGADIEATSRSGATPLLAAIKSDSLEMVAMLLDKGANVKAKKNNGEGIWHLAANINWHGVLEVLMEKVKVIDVRDLEEEDNNGYTPMKHALENDITRIIGLLVKAGVKLEKSNKIREMFFSAIRAGHSEKLEVLLESKAVTPWTRIKVNRVSKYAFEVARDGGLSLIKDVMEKFMARYKYITTLY